MKETTQEHPDKNWVTKLSYQTRRLVLYTLLLSLHTAFSNTKDATNDILPEEPPIERHRMWINFYGETAGFNQFLLGYVTNATNGFDFGLDSKMFGWNGSALYSLIEDNEFNYTIQGRALPFDDYDVVKLGLRVNQAGSFSISIVNVDGIFAEGQDIFLNDHLTQSQHNLKLSDYAFESAAGIYHERFEIVYRPSPCYYSTWIGNQDSDWNTPSNWCDTHLPTTASKVVVNTENPVIINTDVHIDSISIRANSSLTVYGSLTVGNIVVEEGGLLTIANGANLFQRDTAVNTGSIVVERNSALIKHLDYTIWSSPVLEQDLQSFSPLTLPSRIYTYTTSSDSWNIATGNFNPGMGYMFRAPNDFITTPYTYSGTFIGTANNGTITTNFSQTGQYQGIGNPYASNLDIDEFWAANPGAGTLYFWTNSNPWDNASQSYAANNWATYSYMGGATAAGGTQTPTAFIPVGQGFVAETDTSLSSITFNNAMRTSQSGVFFRNATQEKHRLWLNLSNTSRQLNQILIGYMEGATQAEDLRIDAKMYSYQGSALYSMIENSTSEYSIQGRSLPFDDSDVVPLGFRATAPGTYSIGLTSFDGVFAQEQDIFLRDNFTQTLHDLKGGDYSFVSDQGDFTTRFAIVYRTAMGITNPQLDTAWVVYSKDNVSFIETQAVEMKQVIVYDMLGRVVYQSQAKGNTHSFVHAGVNQVVIIKVITTTDKELTKKQAY
ncbi:MAG TPA: hypothetical protein VLZ11_05585 [Flavobacterium sp.]|nr:hypothetical protein [Flavobacterium sp.]